MGNKKHIKLQRSKMNRSELDQVYFHPTTNLQERKHTSIVSSPTFKKKNTCFLGFATEVNGKGQGTRCGTSSDQVREAGLQENTKCLRGKKRYIKEAN